MINSGRTRRKKLMIRLEGHMGCKDRVEIDKDGKKQDTMRKPACQDQKVFISVGPKAQR